MFIFEREKRAGEGQRERETQNLKQAAGSRLRAVSTEPDAGLELPNCVIMTGAAVGRLTDRATQALWTGVLLTQGDLVMMMFSFHLHPERGPRGAATAPLIRIVQK